MVGFFYEGIPQSLNINQLPSSSSFKSSKSSSSKSSKSSASIEEIRAMF